VGSRTNAEAGIGSRDTVVHHFFVLPPPSEKRRTKSARPEEAKGSWRFLHEDRRIPRGFLRGQAILRRETEKGSCPEEKKVSGINLERKVGSQGEEGLKLKKTFAAPIGSKKLVRRKLQIP